MKELKEGRYQLERLIGQGGTGSVYFAKDFVQDRDVVVKMLDKVMSQSQMSAMEELIREGKQKGIAQLFDCFIEDEKSYYVCEYIPGYNGVELLEKGECSVEQVMHASMSAMEALIWLHGNRILLGDISTDNVIFSETEGMVLVDFDTIQSLDEDEATRRSSVKNGFAALELYTDNGTIGCGTDIYAFCATLYHLLTGNIPTGVIMRQENVDLPTFQACNVLLPEEIEQYIMRGMAIQYEHRLDDLQPFLETVKKMYMGKNIKVEHIQESTRSEKPAYMAKDIMKTYSIAIKEDASVDSIVPNTAVHTEESVSTKKTKRKKVLVATTVIACIAFVLGGSVFFYVQQNKKNDTKQEEQKEQDKKEQKEELAKVQAEEQEKLEKYQRALELVADETEESGEEAVKLLKELGDFQDSYQVLYDVAGIYCSYSMYDKAVDVYRYLGSFNDAAEQLLTCEFIIAYTDQYECGKYELARASFLELGDYYSEQYEISAADMAEECNYQHALKVLDDEEIDKYELVREILVSKQAYDALSQMADSYLSHQYYDKALELYKWLDTETVTSYEDAIRQCETLISSKEKYASYSKEESSKYDEEAGSMVSYVDEETVEEYLESTYGDYVSDGGEALTFTKLEINGRKYAVKNIQIDTKEDLKIVVFVFYLDDTENIFSIEFDSCVEYTYKDDYDQDRTSTRSELKIGNAIYY